MGVGDNTLPVDFSQTSILHSRCRPAVFQRFAVLDQQRGEPGVNGLPRLVASGESASADNGRRNALPCLHDAPSHAEKGKVGGHLTDDDVVIIREVTHRDAGDRSS